MESKLHFSFDDESVSKSCYDLNNKKIEIYYSAYYDLHNNEKYIEKPCVFIIKNWVAAKSSLGPKEYLYDLKKHLGIIAIINYMALKDKNLEMFVDTINGDFVTLLFIEPELNFNVL